MDDLQIACDHFIRTFGLNRIGPERLLCVWTLSDKRAKFFTLPCDAAEYAMKRRARSDVYYGVALARSIPEGGARGEAANAAEIGSLWADLDIAGAGHKDSKKKLPPDQDAVEDILLAIGLLPTSVIHSGGGIQAYWRLAEPLTISTPEEMERAKGIIRRWGHTVLAVARSVGYEADPVHDLARVLRVPGTYNLKVKGERRPVVAASLRKFSLPTAGPGYTLDELELVMVAEDSLPSSTGPLIDVAGLRLALDAKPDSLKFDALIANHPKFGPTWEMKRRDLKDSSASSYDLSLATIAVQAGWADQEVANLLIAFRVRHGEKPEKAMRRGYLQSTIAKARTTTVDAAVAERLSTHADLPAVPASEMTDDRRSKFLADISKALGVPLVRFIQHGSENATYYVALADGRQIRIGPVGSVLDPARFREPLIVATGKLIPLLRGATWKGVQRLLWSIRELEENEEAQDSVKASLWISSYLERTSVCTGEEWAVGAWERRPFIRTDESLPGLFVFAAGLQAYLRNVQRERITDGEVFQVLRAAGFSPRVVFVPTKKGKATSRHYWYCPLNKAASMLPTTAAERTESKTPI